MGQIVRENEVFKIIKLDVGSNAVSSFLNTTFFLKRLSL